MHLQSVLSVVSFVRFSNESDVYVFLHSSGSLCCCMCALGPLNGLGLRADFHVARTQGMLDHLDDHRRAGHRVTSKCLAKLRSETWKTDNWIRRQERARRGEVRF
jgi:hypothetical protein